MSGGVELAHEHTPASAGSRSQQRVHVTWRWHRVASWLVVWKVVFFAVALACMELWPCWEEGEYSGHRRLPFNGDATLSSRFATWDAAHYLYLAAHGYKKREMSCAFYPAMPALIRGGSYLAGGNLFLSAMILAQVVSILGVLAFHRLAFELRGERVAHLATAFLLAFPGAIFFSFPYTEGLFLLLACLFLLCLYREQMWKAALVGVLLPLTKGIGVFCLAPMAWQWWSKKRPASEALSFYGIIAGYVLYFLVMYAFTGNPTEGYEAQLFYPHQPSIGNMVKFGSIAKEFVNVGSFHDSMNSALDRSFFVLFLASLPFVWRLNKTLFWYALFAGLIPALSIWFFSYSRHVMMAFPMFMVLAVLLQKPALRWLRLGFLAGLAGLQLFFLVRHVNFMWAG